MSHAPMATSTSGHLIHLDKNNTTVSTHKLSHTHGGNNYSPTSSKGWQRGEKGVEYGGTSTAAAEAAGGSTSKGWKGGGKGVSRGSQRGGGDAEVWKNRNRFPARLSTLDSAVRTFPYLAASVRETFSKATRDVGKERERTKRPGAKRYPRTVEGVDTSQTHPSARLHTAPSESSATPRHPFEAGNNFGGSASGGGYGSGRNIATARSYGSDGGMGVEYDVLLEHRWGEYVDRHPNVHIAGETMDTEALYSFHAEDVPDTMVDAKGGDVIHTSQALQWGQQPAPKSSPMKSGFPAAFPMERPHPHSRLQVELPSLHVKLRVDPTQERVLPVEERYKAAGKGNNARSSSKKATRTYGGINSKKAANMSATDYMKFVQIPVQKPSLQHRRLVHLDPHLAPPYSILEPESLSVSRNTSQDAKDVVVSYGEPYLEYLRRKSMLEMDDMTEGERDSYTERERETDEYEEEDEVYE